MSPIKWAAHDTDVECTKPEKFGMYHGRPCVMVKLNKVYGWEPEPYYNITEVTLSLFRNTNICGHNTIKLLNFDIGIGICTRQKAFKHQVAST